MQASNGGVLPLRGVKVVEIGQNIAGPYASQILSQLGADVVKVERPEGGDDARGWAPEQVWQRLAGRMQAEFALGAEAADAASRRVTLRREAFFPLWR